MDYPQFCRLYSQATCIPTTLLDGVKPIYAYMQEILNMPLPREWGAYWTDCEISFEYYSPDIEYGRVNIVGTDLRVILGPLFPIGFNEDILHRYIHEINAATQTKKERVIEAQSSIPLISHAQAARHLTFICQCVNGHSPSTTEIITHTRESWRREQMNIANPSQEPTGKQDFEDTYRFEQNLCNLVSSGDVFALKTFLTRAPLQNIKEVKSSPLPLRHAKNTFIEIATQIMKTSAISTGMDISDAYTLLGVYVSECEKMQSMEGVQDLQYSFLLDICERCNKSRLPEGISTDVRKCLRFIRGHIYDSVSVNDVAAYVGLSVSHTERRFKSEMGCSLGNYITHCKLEEAKSLLLNTDKPLSEISEMLNFSDQSHFQNAFKKVFGITPMRFRNQKQLCNTGNLPS